MYNVEEDFLEELEDCPCTMKQGRILTTTCRSGGGSEDDEDCFIYVTDEKGRHNLDGNYTFYRINIGQFVYSEWEERTLNLPYYLRMDMDYLMAHPSDKDKIVILYECNYSIKYLNVDFSHAYQTNF